MHLFIYYTIDDFSCTIKRDILANKKQYPNIEKAPTVKVMMSMDAVSSVLEGWRGSGWLCTLMDLSSCPEE